MKIYLLLAHHNTNSFNGALADAYEARAKERGHEVRRQNLGELMFDPVLKMGQNATQELEPDLKQAQDNITWCERWVIFYPLWDKLLKGRSAQVFITSDAPRIWIALQYRNSDIHALKYATLEFCGIAPVRVRRFCGVRNSDKKRREAWIDQVRRAVP